ncbi:DNA polymerase Y family protein [Wenjunlia vitaminophila]|uniref:DNA polymerase Y family protein n=1 Tax=Wenjunlia vitaminophila TaxID=76728 RepID=UPI001F2CC4CD|nr:hypothetical protein [Wenjunlia vitaminophila]
MTGTTLWYVRWHTGAGPRTGEPPPGPAPELLDLLYGITPVVEVLPPNAALADVRGALRYFDRGPEQLAELLRVRTFARYGVTCAIGVAGNRMLATMAAWAGPADGVHVVPGTPEAVAAFLRPRPVADLPGVGPATAGTLARHGLYTIGDVADLPLPTLQRLLGRSAGRHLHEHARGHDPRPVVRHAPAPSLTAERAFPLDTVDQAVVRRALLALTVDLGAELRGTGQVAHALTLVVRYADRSTTTRSRALPDPANSTAALTRCAYRLQDALGLQRARVRAVALRADGLTPAATTPAQLSLDPVDERARRLEAVADRAAARFTSGVVSLATLLPPRDAA